jgi:hypothetical protein
LTELQESPYIQPKYARFAKSYQICQLSGVNYFSALTTIISPGARREIQLSPNNQVQTLWGGTRYDNEG